MSGARSRLPWTARDEARQVRQDRAVFAECLQALVDAREAFEEARLEFFMLNVGDLDETAPAGMPYGFAGTYREVRQQAKDRASHGLM